VGGHAARFRLVKKGADQPGGQALALPNLQAHSEFGSARNPYFTQAQPMGALPTLYAAAAGGVQGGDYYGPGGFMQLRGHPKKVASNKRSHDTAMAKHLWEVSEQMTGVMFEFAHTEREKRPA
jgi:hypothetical protein